MSISIGRHYMVEFAGMPKSGKTTIMDTVSHYLKRSGAEISEFHGGGRYAPVGKDQLGRLNMYLACEAVRYCISSQGQRMLPGVHLLDRGLVDRIIFTNALKEMSRVTAGHADAINAFFGIPEMYQQIDLCFVFVTTPALSLQREERNKLSRKSGRVMNNSFLANLRAAAERVALEREEMGFVRRIVLVDTAELDGDVISTARLVTNELVGELKRAGLDIPLVEEP